MAYGLNPVTGPAVPSRPTTNVPGAGGEFGTDVPPVGAIGAGRFGGVQPATSRQAVSIAPTHPAPRSHPAPGHLTRATGGPSLSRDPSRDTSRARSSRGVPAL